ncbi:hypothetical protein L1987_42494 [Smallanthus sonchifolius]|uniref:Uncharacterized protein n=1 Tax=Smallanthus sonchifolius TaxID=185202 RepID=A0ACB9GIU5_9ASTR|nr:hypothetical protein L1987_42494 [Smallanthus sonchifolius]
MAPGTITALKNLDAMKDDYTVKVRIIRLWTRPTFRNPLSVYCYDMILMDEEVQFIEVSISESSTTQSGFTTSIFTRPEDEFLNKNQFSSIGEINVTKEAFKIYVGEFNLANNKDGYTISKVTVDPSIILELEKKFDLVQVTDSESFNPDLFAECVNTIAVKDSFSCTGEEATPVSNILKSKKDSPVEDQITPSSMFVGGELKRNLQCIYDVDEGSSQSSTKPRTCYKTDDDNAYKRVEEDGGCKGKLLIPKVEK